MQPIAFGSCKQHTEGFVGLKVVNGDLCGGVYVPLSPVVDLVSDGEEVELLPPKSPGTPAEDIFSDGAEDELLPTTLPGTPAEEAAPIPTTVLLTNDMQVDGQWPGGVPDTSVDQFPLEYIDSDNEDDKKYAEFAVHVQKRLYWGAVLTPGRGLISLAKGACPQAHAK